MDAVRDYRMGQFAAFDPEGAALADEQVEHVYTLRDGLIERMDIR